MAWIVATSDTTAEPGTLAERPCARPALAPPPSRTRAAMDNSPQTAVTPTEPTATSPRQEGYSQQTRGYRHVTRSATTRSLSGDISADMPLADSRPARGWRVPTRPNAPRGGEY